MRLVVISDIHVGAGVLDDCDAELESGIVAFLEDLAAHPVPTTLVINGDFLDFPQAEPWQSGDLESATADGVPLCFTEEQSVQKLGQIVQSHGAIFAALHRIACRGSKHRVVILPGNHDADFFWPRVREDFIRAIADGDENGADRLHFRLQQSYRPTEFPAIWIEHGHQYDACNKFAVRDVPCWSEEAKPIFPDHRGVPRLLECVGTRFLIKFLNRLDADYPFVDNVKPFSKFVKMFLASTVHRDFGPIRALIAYWGFLSFFAGTLRKSPTDLLSSDQPLDKMLNQFRERLGQIPRRDTDSLVTEMTRLGFDFKGVPISFYVSDDRRLQEFLDFLCEHPALSNNFKDDGAGLLSAGEAGYLTLRDGYRIDETAALKSAAARIIRDESASGVIMGHTHEAVQPDSGLNYVNVGCWTRYLREGINRRREWSWNLLKKSGYQSFPYELAYAEVVSEHPRNLVRCIFRP